jgi:hypothetical protein
MATSDHYDEDLDTPELDTFLTTSAAGMVPKRLNGADLKAKVHELFVPTQRELDDYPQPENQPQRILALWRIIRVLTRICSVTAEDETLDTSLSNLEPDPWYDGITPSPSPIQQQLLRKMTQNCLLDSYNRAKEHFERNNAKIIEKLDHSIKTPADKAKNTKLLRGTGIPLLPSTISITKTNYWHEVASTVAVELNIYNTDIGARGMQGLFHPHTAQYANVTPLQIMAAEDLLVDEAQRLIIRVGERPAIDKFRQKYGFSRGEAHSLMRLARAEALRMDGSTIDENRAIMVAMLKDFVAQTKHSLNQRDQLAALKELAKVQGLLKQAPEDMAMDFLDVINRVAARQDRVRSLTEDGQSEGSLVEGQPRIVDATPVPRLARLPPIDPDSDDDEEDLGDFDEEKELMR